jgi:ABC-2 type transport system permease protein
LARDKQITLVRHALATTAPLEVTIAMLLLVAAIALMTWVAGRIYKAGVLLYGQKAGIRQMWRAVREAQ